MNSDLEKVLSSFKDMRAGVPLDEVVTATWINMVQLGIELLAAGKNIKRGANTRLSHGPGWVKISADKGSGFDSGSDTHPFEVTVKELKVDGDSHVNGATLSVELDSWLMNTERWDDKVTITGLGGDGFDVKKDEKIWLELKISGGAVASATIDHGEVGEGKKKWKTFPNPFGYDRDDDPKIKENDKSQVKLYQLLAYLSPDKEEKSYRPGISIPFQGDNQLLIQTTYTNLILCEKCYSVDGQLVKTVAPWHAPYVPNEKK